MSRFCNDCKHCIRNLACHDDGCVNFKCTHPVDNIQIPTGRLVKFRAFKTELVLAPDWCPLLEEEHKAIQEAKNARNKPKKWDKYYDATSWDIEKKLLPLFNDVNIEDIKVGDKYHIPPLNAEKRHKVVVRNITNYCVECETVGEEYQRTIFLYKNSLKIRLIKKIEDE